MGVNGTEGKAPKLGDVSPRDADAVGEARAAKMAEERHEAFLKAMTAQAQHSTFSDWLITICTLAIVIPLVIALWKWALR